MALVSDSTNWNMYICKQTHTSSDDENPLVVGANWSKTNNQKPIATSLILAQQILADYIDVESLVANSAFITKLNTKDLKAKEITTENSGSGFLQMIGNVLNMFDKDNGEHLKVHGGTLSTIGGTAYNDPSSEAVASATKTFTSGATSDYTVTKTVRTRSITEKMLLTLPPQSFSCNANGVVESGTHYFLVTVQWLVDGVAKKAQSGSMTISSTSQRATTSVSLPGGTLELAAGSHTIAIKTTLKYSGGSGLGDNDSVQVTSTSTVATGTVLWATPIQKTEIANNGFRIALTANTYFIVNLAGAESTIQMMNGRYGLRLTSSGLQRTANGGTTWINIE